MYMILTSYFKKAECKSKYWEKELFLYYNELEAREQIHLEKKCIHIVCSAAKQLPKDIWKAEVKVYMYRHNNAKETEFRIEGNKYRLFAKAYFNPKGKVCGLFGVKDVEIRP